MSSIQVPEVAGDNADLWYIIFIPEMDEPFMIGCPDEKILIDKLASIVNDKTSGWLYVIKGQRWFLSNDKRFLIGPNQQTISLPHSTDSGPNLEGWLE